MAVTGLIIHAEPGRIGEVEADFAARSGVTLYGRHEDSALVAVLEAPAAELETRLEGLAAADGVLAVQIAQTSVEDEIEAEEP